MNSFDHGSFRDIDEDGYDRLYDYEDDESPAPNHQQALQEFEALHAPPAVQPWSRPAAGGLRTFRRGRTHAFDAPGFLGESFQEWRDRTPPGWHGILAETLHRLEAVISIDRDAVERPWRIVPERPNFFDDLAPEEMDLAFDITDERREDLKMLVLTVTGMALKFDGSLFISRGSVLKGILRKAEAASRCTCRQCGAVGKARSWTEDAVHWDAEQGCDRRFPDGKQVATLCARCFAPVAMREQLRDLDRLVIQAQQQRCSVRQHQLPGWMRSSFVGQARDDLLMMDRDGEPGWDDPAMESEAFRRWSTQWFQIGGTLRLSEIRR